MHAAGLRDPASVGALADLYFPVDRDRARAYLDELARFKNPPAEIRAAALPHWAHYALEDGDYESAIAYLREAVRLRRYAEDWHMLGIAYLRQGQPLKALAPLHQALAIRPYRPRIHRLLADAYRELGDLPHADDHVKKAAWFMKHEQD